MSGIHHSTNFESKSQESEQQPPVISNGSGSDLVVDVSITCLRESIQNTHLKVPVNWRFGQILQTLHRFHPDLSSLPLNQLSFLCAGKHLDSDSQVQDMLKGSSHIQLYLKVDHPQPNLDPNNPQRRSALLCEEKHALDTEFGLSSLWTEYSHILSPFIEAEGSTVFQQQSNIKMEILGRTMPFLSPLLSPTLVTLAGKQSAGKANAAASINNTNQVGAAGAAALNDNAVAEGNHVIRLLIETLTFYFIFIHNTQGYFFWLLVGGLLTFQAIRHQNFRANNRRVAAPHQPNRAQLEPNIQQHQQQPQPQLPKEAEIAAAAIDEVSQQGEVGDIPTDNMNTSQLQADLSVLENPKSTEAATEASIEQKEPVAQTINYFKLYLLKLFEFVWCLQMSLFPPWNLQEYRNSNQHLVEMRNVELESRRSKKTEQTELQEKDRTEESEETKEIDASTVITDKIQIDEQQKVQGEFVEKDISEDRSEYNTIEEIKDNSSAQQTEEEEMNLSKTKGGESVCEEETEEQSRNLNSFEYQFEDNNKNDFCKKND